MKKKNLDPTSWSVKMLSATSKLIPKRKNNMLI